MLIHEVYKANEYISRTLATRPRSSRARSLTTRTPETDHRHCGRFPKKDPSTYTRRFVISEVKPVVASIPVAAQTGGPGAGPRPHRLYRRKGKESKAPAEMKRRWPSPWWGGRVRDKTGAQNTGGQRELPLNGAQKQETPAAEKIDLKMPPSCAVRWGKNTKMMTAQFQRLLQRARYNVTPRHSPEDRQRPWYRIDGEMSQAEGEVYTVEMMDEVLAIMLNPDQMAYFKKRGEVDLSYTERASGASG